MPDEIKTPETLYDPGDNAREKNLRRYLKGSGRENTTTNL